MTIDGVLLSTAPLLFAPRLAPVQIRSLERETIWKFHCLSRPTNLLPLKFDSMINIIVC